MMTAKELAGMLTGRECRNEIFPEEERIAKNSGLDVVYGYSDDCVELRGAIDDEIGAYNGTTIFVSREGKLLDNPDCNNPECPHYKAAVDSAVAIQAIWHNQGGPCWTFRTAIPHATFTIVDEETLFCEGIVFSLDDVRNAETNNHTPSP